MPTVYGILDADTRAWWYHRELRKHGQHEEARQRERKGIKSSTSMLRDTLMYPAGYAYVGRGGYSLHAKNRTLGGYGGLESKLVQAAPHLGIPTINTLAVPDYLICKTISFPMIRDPPDNPPYHALAYAPLNHVIPSTNNSEPTCITGQSTKRPTREV